MYFATLFANEDIYLTRDTLEQLCALVLGDRLCARVSKTQGYREPRVYNNYYFYTAVGWYYSEVTLGRTASEENVSTSSSV
jgi:hypothetical protein